ncbi:MAG: TetR/AcrR family transcriptional regulator [Firmicutes bacterium]|nr:TetR/AcrR family transcriptional regulator [Bacillota bacterium]
MDLKGQYLEELSLLKNDRINRVIQAAKIEFGLHGITNSKLKSIAKRAMVGEASVYRYFADKTALVKMVGLEYWDFYVNLFTDFFEQEINEKDNGLQKVEAFLNIFHVLYNEHKDFLKFMEEFDNYMMSNTEENKVSSVEELIGSMKAYYINIFDSGVLDGSIDNSFSGKETYSFVSQVMLSTTQKLSFRVGYLHTDEDLYPEHCISRLIEMFILYIKAK